MTEDSQNRVRNYGPFPEGAEPTAQIPAPATGPRPGAEAASPKPASPDPASPQPHPQQPGTIAAPQKAPVPTEMPAQTAYGPFNNDPDPYGFASPPGRRIEPSPPKKRSRLLIGLAAGLTAGLLVFGTAGYFVGRGSTTATPTPAPTPKTEPSQGVFERNQVTINSADFQGTGLTPFAQGWLPYIATCNRSGTPGGPSLNSGEKTRVRCTLDGMSAIFVEYNSVADRDKARVKTLSQAVDARTLTPGAAAPAQRPAPSERTSGNYVEYAYRLTERGTTRTISGVWWDDAKTPVAGYLLAYWKEGVGESWEPIRDLWSRYA